MSSSAAPGILSPEAIRRRAEAIRWYHTMDLGHGVVTKGSDQTPLRLSRMGLPDRLDGKSVLDIGAWDGFYSFEAERRGAARVLATDSFVWQGQTWGSKEGFEFARSVFGSEVDDREIDVLDLSPSTVGQFDYVFFLGVLYHLKNPLLALERVASVTKGTLILETVVDLLNLGRPAMAFYPGDELTADATNWWAPNLSCLTAMLKVCGFTEVKCLWSPSFARRAAYATLQKLRGSSQPADISRGRAVVHATRK